MSILKCPLLNNLSEMNSWRHLLALVMHYSDINTFCYISTYRNKTSKLFRIAQYIDKVEEECNSFVNAIDVRYI